MTIRRKGPKSRRSNRVLCAALLAFAPLSSACTSAEQGQSAEAPAPCVAGEVKQPVVGCQAGIPAARCATGFASNDDMGCDPVLPADPCPDGKLALPGEPSCHDVADCGSGSYGAIPVEASTQFVDGSYAGGGSDGTQAKPWTTR